ncbi:MAG: RNA pyrophosphohydrolase [Pseudomonadota bacterium]
MGGFAHLPYRLGVGMMVFNARGEVFVAKRIDMTSEAWQMPQGGIDDGEHPRDAALRELREEIGTDAATILHEAPEWFAYDLPDALVPILWKGQYRGQKQRWFALRLDAEAVIDIGTDHAEFSEYRWAPIDTLPDLIVPFKRELYVALVAAFRHLAVPVA